jgi:CRP/FNR family transcriptional regulator, dissimilatory nitrate respiration regulator
MSIDLYQQKERSFFNKGYSGGISVTDMVHTDLLKRIDLFHGLPEPVLGELATTALLRQFRPGQVIVAEGAGERNLHALLSGRVKMFKASPDGKEQTLFLFGPGEAFCLWTLFQKHTSPGTIAALETSRLLVIPGSGIERTASVHPALLHHFVVFLSRRLKQATQLIEALSLKGTDQRLAAFLLHRCSMSCEGPETDLFELCITQRELAKMLGTTPETLSRVIRRMEEEGLIEGTGRTIRIVDRPGLHRMVTA